MGQYPTLPINRAILQLATRALAWPAPLSYSSLAIVSDGPGVLAGIDGPPTAEDGAVVPAQHMLVRA